MGARSYIFAKSQLVDLKDFEAYLVVLLISLLLSQNFNYPRFFCIRHKAHIILVLQMQNEFSSDLASRNGF